MSYMILGKSLHFPDTWVYDLKNGSHDTSSAYFIGFVFVHQKDDQKHWQPPCQLQDCILRCWDSHGDLHLRQRKKVQKQELSIPKLSRQVLKGIWEKRRAYIHYGRRRKIQLAESLLWSLTVGLGLCIHFLICPPGSLVRWVPSYSFYK